MVLKHNPLTQETHTAHASLCLHTHTLSSAPIIFTLREQQNTPTPAPTLSHTHTHTKRGVKDTRLNLQTSSLFIWYSSASLSALPPRLSHTLAHTHRCTYLNLTHQISATRVQSYDIHLIILVLSSLLSFSSAKGRQLHKGQATSCNTIPLKSLKKRHGALVKTQLKLSSIGLLVYLG